MLIAAISGRALAQSARCSGYAPLVADFFADLDTAEVSEAVVKVEGAFGEGFKREPLMRALKQLAAGRHPIGIVSGAGFEQSGDLLIEVAAHWPVFGNEPKTIANLKSPLKFAELCAKLAIPHPETQLDPPHSGEWLVKETGASGGSHIKPYFPLLPSEGWEKGAGGRMRALATAQQVQRTLVGLEKQSPHPPYRAPSPMPRGTGEGGAKCYFQRRISGESISALFLADGRSFQLVGFSHQWTSPTADEPFRYGGAVQPVEAPEDLLKQFIAQIISAIPLKGLNSADFIIDGDKHWLLEINPRPGATVDIFPGELFKAHVEACQGKLPSQPFSFKGALAAATVYAEQEIASVAAIDWPGWAIDRQAPGTRVSAGEPLCTVKAEADSVDEAIKLVRQREVSIRQQLEGNAA